MPFQLVKIANWLFLNVSFSGGLKIFYGNIRFFFTLEKIKYKSNQAASSDFAATSRGMIIYTGKYFSNWLFQLE